MMKIAIVDDEPLERKAMRKMIENSMAGAEIVGEAENGRRAVKLARAKRPDIILMDIKMSGMDGIAAIREIRAFSPKTRFIMVTAFDEFEYAREVMREGVKEYLLKPVQKKEVLATLERVRREIEQEQEYEEQMAQTRELAASEWVASLLLDHVRELGEDEWRKMLGIRSGRMYALVCKIEPDQEEASGWKHDVYRWLKETFAKMARGIVGPMAGRQIPVLVFDVPDGQLTERARAVRLSRQLTNEFSSTFPDMDLYVGAGTAVGSFDRFPASYQEALVALGNTNREVKTMVYDTSMKANDEERSFYEAEKRLLQAVQEGDDEELNRAFSSYVRHLEQEAAGNIEKMKKRIEEWQTVMRRTGRELGLSFELGPVEGETREKLAQNMKRQALLASEAVKKWKAEQAGGAIHQAKKYIAERYSEPLQLEDVANAVRLSPYYFSKMFKESEGMTFVEYLTQTRVDAARKLLREREKSLKEICFLVGYRDPNYFSRVFKKVTGHSPREYRQKMSGEKK